MTVTRECAEALKGFGSAAGRARDVFLSDEWESVHTMSDEKRARTVETLRNVARVAQEMASNLDYRLEAEGEGGQA